MSSGQDIVSLTTSAVEALDAINNQAFEERKISGDDDFANDNEPMPIESIKEVKFGGDVVLGSGRIPREISPQVPDSNVEIVDIQGATTRYKDRTLGSQGSSNSSIVGHLKDETILKKAQVEMNDRPVDKNVKITRFEGSVKESRQKLASRKRISDPSAFQDKGGVYPKIVQAQLIRGQSGAKSNGRSSTEKAILDQYEKENHPDHAAILSAATSAAAAAAVGTQPVLQKIESQISALADKVDSLEAGQVVLDRAESPLADRRLTGAAGDVEERLMRELAVERELTRERERQRNRDELRRAKQQDKFQRRLLALTALQSRTRAPMEQQTPVRAEGRKPHLLEQILTREEEPEERREEPRREEAEPETRRKLVDVESRLNSELASIRTEFEDLRRRAEAIAVPEPATVSPPRPLPILPSPPPRTGVLELAERQLERIGAQQENLEQNIAAIERAREAEFFYSVLNDLSGDQNAINSAVTRIMVDDALKKASREAKRQVEREWRSGRRPNSPPVEPVKPQRAAPTRQAGPRRGPQAKVDSGLRRRPASPSPPRDPFGSVNSLVDFNVLRPGQLGNRRQRGEKAPYLHFANEVRERQRSPVAVSHQSVRREASDSWARRPVKEGKTAGARSHVPKTVPRKSSPPRGRTAKKKKKAQCRLLSFQQRDGVSPGRRRAPPHIELPPKSVTPTKPEITEVVIDEAGNITPTSIKSDEVNDSIKSESIRSESTEIQPADDLESVVSEATSRRSEDGEGLELPGWRRPERKKPRDRVQTKRGTGVDRRPPAPPPVTSARTGRDPLEARIRNRLEDEVIAEVVSRMGHQRELAVQTQSPEPSEAEDAPIRPDTARLRHAVQEVVLTEAMRLLRRSLPQPPLRTVQHGGIQVLTPVPTPIPSPEGPSIAEESMPRRSPVQAERVEYSDEFEDEDEEDEEEESEFEAPKPRGKLASPTVAFSPRRDVLTPTRSEEEEEEEEEEKEEEQRITMPKTPELSPREEEEDEAPVPTPRWRPQVTSPPPMVTKTMVDLAVQTVDDTGVQTVAVTEVQTEVETPEPPPVETSEQLSLSSGESSSETYPPTDSMMSDGQWMLDRSEGQHHDICVDWALRQQLATAAMTSRRRPETADSSTDLTAEVRTLTEEGEAVWTRRYEPQRDLLMQLLMEQQRHARSGVILPQMQGILDSAGATLVSGDLDTLSMGQVPRPVPRYRRRRSGGDVSGATSSGINDEGLEDTPVRDSAGSLPPGVIRVRESMGSEDTQHDLQGTQGSQLAVTASEGETRGSDKLDIDLARYLGMSMNTTTGTIASDDLTKTGMLSTTQLIQDALQTTELSGTGEPSFTHPQPRHRVNITVPTLAEVPSDSPSPDEDVSEILMP